MDKTLTQETWTYALRLQSLRTAKLLETKEKQEVVGSMDHDDHGLILPPEDRREIVKTLSSSGMPIIDCLIKGFEVKPNHSSGGFFGPKSCGENFKALLEVHPVYIDPISSLAGAYMVNFMSYRNPGWNPDFDFSYLNPGIEKYKLLPGIGATQHFCQDLAIGLRKGWGGILKDIRKYRAINPPDRADFYDGLEAVVLGIQQWIQRHVDQARQMAEGETDPQIRTNLEEIAEMNEYLVSYAPRTFREACQWILWFLIVGRMYNGSGSEGRIDVFLNPYYQKEKAAGTLTDEDAIFHLACMIIREPAYIQLGGPDENGKDVTNPVSFLVLEAAHRLRIPANIGVCVGKDVDPNLLRRGVEIMFADKASIPKFLGIDSTTEGFTRNGFPVELARQRAYSGCHWSALPGIEYTMNDCVKINFAAVFEYAFNEMLGDQKIVPSVTELWNRFSRHLKNAVEITKECQDFHMEHMHQVFPELVVDLLCYGPVEKGLDATHGGVDYYNLCIDGSALATVADSFAAIEQRVERENRMNWRELKHFLDSNWSGSEGEKARLMMRSIPRYGSGNSVADEYAICISQAFTKFVKENPTPNGFNLIPGLFSWANTIPMGKDVGATPNGRYAGAPISHGSNPDPGFRKDGAPTAMAVAIASVQCGYGNTAPMQIELDPMVSREEGGVDIIANLIRSHFDMGGTQINLNIMDAAQVLEAHKDPSKFPDLVVRVTGFSAFFASLSPEFRQIVVDRIIAEKD
jgi:pyruvate-formate lyase